MSESSVSQNLTPITADSGNKAVERTRRSILDFLFGQRNATGVRIGTEVPGRRRTKIAALKQLVSEGTVLRIGSGRKCDPFRYRLSQAESRAHLGRPREVYEEVI